MRLTTPFTPIVLALLWTAPALAAEDEPKKASASLAASLEFQLGLSNTVEAEVDGAPAVEDDGQVLVAIVPGFDKFYGKVFAVGAEYMFVWAGADGLDERRLVMSLHPRVRMSFPVVNKLTLDAMLGLGPTIWTEQTGVPEARGGGVRLGWSLRFAFGAGWQFNDSVAAFGSLGYYTSTTYGEDLTANIASVPLSVGLRSVF
jgi:hypothetical protein